MAFAPGFALLADDKRWINDVKFPRALVEKYYRENFDADTRVEFINMNPGDYFLDGKFHADSPYNKQLHKDSLSHLIETIYEKEITAFNNITPVTEEKTSSLEAMMEKTLNDNRNLYHADVLRDVAFTLVVTDAVNDNVFNVSFNGGKFTVERSHAPAEDSRLILRTRAHLLEHALQRTCGAVTP